MCRCPNCGAPITGSNCEYCGTVFDAEADSRAYDRNKHCVRLDNFIPMEDKQHDVTSADYRGRER